MYDFFQNLFSIFLGGFRKGFSVQHSLARLLKKWQDCLDKKGVVGTVLIDLSKAYDCIQHDLLIAKLAAYGFSHKSLSFIFSYLRNRKQRVKLGSFFGTWLEVFLGIPQGSILGPLLFNIFINDLLLIIKETDVCNFADDNTLFACDITVEAAKHRLISEIENVTNWFRVNSLVANPSKFQLMFLGINEPVSLHINGKVLLSENHVKLLGVIIDNKLNFSTHIQSICKTANNKVSQLLRMRSNMSMVQARLIVNAYILPYFIYCPLIWMFCQKKSNNLINKVHKRALRAIHEIPSLDFKELLDIENSMTIHVKHLQILMIETYQSLNHNNPQMMWDLFHLKDMPYNLRGEKLLQIPPAKTITYGTNSLFFKASILWNSLPNEYKTANSLNEFKTAIRLWEGTSCSCLICK